MSPKLQSQIAKSKEQALAAFIAKKGEIDDDAYSAPGAQRRPLQLRPDEIDWGHVGTLGYYAELLKRVTDSAFKEGEHAG